MIIKTTPNDKIKVLLHNEVVFYTDEEMDLVWRFAAQTIADDRENQWNGKMTGSQALFLLINNFGIKKGVGDWYMVRYFGQTAQNFCDANMVAFASKIVLTLNK